MKYEVFISTVYSRASRLKFIILVAGLCAAAVVFIYCKSLPKIYSATATVFPLNATNDNAGAASALSSLLGLSETPKSFVQEASINIVDLAVSRNTREAVAMERIPELQNEKVANLVIREYNKTKPFYKSNISEPTDTAQLAAVGADLLKDNFAASINKNGILEIHYSNTDEKLLRSISYIFVDKISIFYKELKVRKAKLDYDFMNEKVDSLEQVLASFDKSAVDMSNTTLYVAPDRLQFQLPKTNLADEKSRVSRQRDLATDNREEALWRLQKVTPIIALLDKPDPPYPFYRTSAIISAAITFILTCILFVLVLSAVPVLSYLRYSIRESLQKKD